MDPRRFDKLTPPERTALSEKESAEIRAFYSGLYQTIRREFAKLFPSADWRIENAAFAEWARLANVPDYSHGNATWELDECQRLTATADAFRSHLTGILAGSVGKPDWAKQLPPPRKPQSPHSC